MSPFSQRLILRRRQVMCSCVLDLACVFWSNSEGKVMAAFIAMASRSDSRAKALKRRVSSVTNSLPHAPDD